MPEVYHPHSLDVWPAEMIDDFCRKCGISPHDTEFDEGHKLWLIQLWQSGRLQDEEACLENPRPITPLTVPLLNPPPKKEEL